MKTKTPKLSSLRDKCDKLLTPIVKLISPHCECCGGNTEVAHHWIEKSRSSYLRYDFRNIIALCNSCHTKIHNLFGNSITGSLTVADIIIRQRGSEWRESLDKDSTTIQKVNKEYYIEKFIELTHKHGDLIAKQKKQ